MPTTEPHIQPCTATDSQPARLRCRHILTSGLRCQSPCLRQQEFCYFHHTTRRPVAAPRKRRSRSSTFELAHPEDRDTIQTSIGEVLRRIAGNDIDLRRAGLLLYGLQIASSNLPRVKTLPTPPSRDAEDALDSVEEIILDPTHGPLAPRAECRSNRRETVVGRIIRELEAMPEFREETHQSQPQNDPPNHFNAREDRILDDHHNGRLEAIAAPPQPRSGQPEPGQQEPGKPEFGALPILHATAAATPVPIPRTPVRRDGLSRLLPGPCHPLRNLCLCPQPSCHPTRQSSFRPEPRGLIARRSGETPAFPSCPLLLTDRAHKVACTRSEHLQSITANPARVSTARRP